MTIIEFMKRDIATFCENADGSPGYFSDGTTAQQEAHFSKRFTH